VREEAAMTHEILAKPNGVLYTIGAGGYVQVAEGQRLTLVRPSEVEILVRDGQTFAVVKGSTATFKMETA
jgi:hypothetical protein